MADNTRRVFVKVTTRDGKDKGAVPTYIEVDRGSGPVRVSGRDLVANMDEFTFELRPGESLTIEGYTPEAIAFDREQAAAFRPDTQQNTEGKVDAPSPAKPAAGPAPGTVPAKPPAPAPVVKPVIVSPGAPTGPNPPTKP